MNNRTREEVVDYLAKLGSDEFFQLYHDVSEKRRGRYRQIDNPPPFDPNRDEAAEWLAWEELGSDPSITSVYYLKDAPGDEIRLIAVNESIGRPHPGKPITVHRYAHSADFPKFKLTIAEVTPEEESKLGTSGVLPSDWRFEQSRRFDRSTVK